MKNDVIAAMKEVGGNTKYSANFPIVYGGMDKICEQQEKYISKNREIFPEALKKLNELREREFAIFRFKEVR